VTTNVGLSHPQIDVDDRDQAVAERIDAGQYQPLPLPDKPLHARDTISVIWPGPPNDRLQVFIGLPIGLSPNVVQSSDASTRNLWPAVTLKTISQGRFERQDTVEKNNIVELHGSEPDFLINFRTKLAQCRWIEPGSEVSFF
jgi:hypothetical protein